MNIEHASHFYTMSNNNRARIVHSFINKYMIKLRYMCVFYSYHLLLFAYRFTAHCDAESDDKHKFKCMTTLAAIVMW